MLVDKDKIIEKILKLFPSEMRKRTKQITDNIFEKLGGYVLAQTLVSGSVWLSMTIGLLIFDIDYALVLGIVCGVLSIIPVVGSALSLFITLVAIYK